MPTDEDPLQDLLTRPNVARIYDSWLGGKDSLAVDRDIAARVAEAAPHVVAGVRANRAFLQRAVAYLAEAGVEQFIDLGSGLPTADNVHQVAGRINPQARVVYVDNDPIVLVHARALLADPRTIVVEGDIREPEKILGDRDVRAHLDFTRPVAVVLAAILHFVTDEKDPWGIVRTFREQLAPGSFLVVSHVTHGENEHQDAGTLAGAELYAETTAPFVVRSREEIGRFFEGFALVEPGLVAADEWRRRTTRATRGPVLAGVGVLDLDYRKRVPSICGNLLTVEHSE
jgi:trans-aconitate methyltransferase